MLLNGLQLYLVRLLTIKLNRMKNYIDSQEHWEDSVNADYDYKKAMEKEQLDNREQPDDRQQCYKTGEVCKYKCSGLCKESC